MVMNLRVPKNCWNLELLLLLLLLLFILTANGFLPGGSGTTITHNTTLREKLRASRM
jgi:hypothetical protein